MGIITITLWKMLLGILKRQPGVQDEGSARASSRGKSSWGNFEGNMFEAFHNLFRSNFDSQLV